MIDRIPLGLRRALRLSAPVAPAEANGVELGRNLPLVPPDSIAGRALVTVIAIMTFLATFVTGIAMLVHGASGEWTDSISREMTIQVRPSPNRDIEADIAKAATIARAFPGVASVRVFSKTESEKLLEPWLGAGLDLGELPIPRLLVLELAPATRLDGEKLKQTLREQSPTATLDDHRLWMERLATMARSLVVVASLVLALVLVAMALAVVFATRGAMAGNKGIVEVLHFVGASDDFIAREFQRHFLRLGVRGAAAGVALAAIAFLIFEHASTPWARGPGGEQVEALFGAFVLGLGGYVVIAIIGGSIALLTGGVSRIIVFRHLRGLD